MNNLAQYHSTVEEHTPLNTADHCAYEIHMQLTSFCSAFEPQDVFDPVVLFYTNPMGRCMQRRPLQQ